MTRLLEFLLVSLLPVYSAVYLNKWAVHVDGGKLVADTLAAKHGFKNLGSVGTLEDYYLFEHHEVSKRSTEPSHHHHTRLKDDPQVHWVEQQRVRSRVKRGVIHGFPASAVKLKDELWDQMWYMHGGAQGGYDMNVIPAWHKGYTGKGVVVTILDDGIEHNHTDLVDNYDPQASYDINDDDDDPMPKYDSVDTNRHGTRCAGEVAAKANNTKCVAGVAYNANIGGVRMLDGDVSDYVEATSLSLNPQHIDIYSASWGPDDNGKVVDGPAKLAKEAFIQGVVKGRGGLGSIFVWASGNGGSQHDNCNCDGYTNSIFTLSISSASEKGTKPWYLEECSSSLATTYSSGENYGERKIVTTDLHGKCTDAHTGTSASAPLAAGICALALEANPHLTWRDMQYVVLMTARPEPLVDGAWITNGVGRKVSHRYGYGLMDASGMVDLAERWTTVPEQHICTTDVIELNSPIESEGIVVTVDTDGCQGTPNEVRHLEHVQAKITLEYSIRGDLQIHLISPNHTRSTLLQKRKNDYQDGHFRDWPFMSVHLWSENPSGTWQLEIENVGSRLNSGIITKWQLIMYGVAENPVKLRDPPPRPKPQPPTKEETKVGTEEKPDKLEQERQHELNITENLDFGEHLVTESNNKADVSDNRDDDIKDNTDSINSREDEVKETIEEILAEDMGMEQDGKGLEENQSKEVGSDETEKGNENEINETLDKGDGMDEGVESVGKNETLHDGPILIENDVNEKDGLEEKEESGEMKEEGEEEKTKTEENESWLAKHSPNVREDSKEEEKEDEEDGVEMKEEEEEDIQEEEEETKEEVEIREDEEEIKVEEIREEEEEEESFHECHEECLSDSGCDGPNPEDCHRCKHIRLASEGACVSACPEGSYADLMSGLCHACLEPCSSCSGGGDHDCLACMQGFYYMQEATTCLTDCPNGFYEDDSTWMCRECDVSCATCRDSPTLCLSCDEDLELSGHTCLKPCTARQFRHHSGRCGDCASDCLRCRGPGAADCLACDQGLLYQNGTCVQTCSDGYYKVISTQNIHCDRCPHTCLSCDTGIDCLTCKNGYKLIQGTCVPICKEGEYELVDGSCLPCDISCLSCKSSATFCSACHRGKYLSEGRCVSECGPEFYLSPGHHDEFDNAVSECLECALSCAECDGPRESDCTKCDYGMMMVDGKCLLSCPNGYYQTSSSTCDKCHHSCQTCDGRDGIDCLSCDASHFLLERQCLKHCLVGYFGSDGHCLHCHHTCHSCKGSGGGECIECAPGYRLEEHKCVEEMQAKSNEDCSQGLYWDQEEKRCVHCDKSCETCQGAGPNNCLSCTLPHKYYKQSCVVCCSKVRSQSCCNCHPHTGVCMENRNIDNADSRNYNEHKPSETRRERPLTHDDGESAKSQASAPSSIISMKNMVTSPKTIVIFVIIVVILSILSFFVIFGLLQARSSEGLCWRHKYEPVPTYYQNGAEKASILTKEDFDDEDEIYNSA